MLSQNIVWVVVGGAIAAAALYWWMHHGPSAQHHGPPAQHALPVPPALMYQGGQGGAPHSHTLLNGVVPGLHGVTYQWRATLAGAGAALSGGGLRNPAKPDQLEPIDNAVVLLSPSASTFTTTKKKAQAIKLNVLVPQDVLTGVLQQRPGPLILHFAKTNLKPASKVYHHNNMWQVWETDLWTYSQSYLAQNPVTAEIDQIERFWNSEYGAYMPEERISNWSPEDRSKPWGFTLAYTHPVPSTPS